MKSNLFARCFVAILLVAGFVLAVNSTSSAQSGPPSSQNERHFPKDSEQEKGSNRPLADNTPVSLDENGTIKMDTALVTVPVSVIDRDGKFVPFLKKRDFRLYEDGVEQDIEIFNSVETPFHVALVLDTSNSTMFKFDDIRDAAFAFIKQLRRDDQVMVVSFDRRVRFHCDFTSDYDELRRALDETRVGGSTKLYEAVDKVVDYMEPIEGRKAIVLFTDGVDTVSQRANYRNTVEKVEESGVLVYPIKYDTEPSSGGDLSEEYRRAARYLQDLANRSGGRLYDANTLYNVSQAFSNIAEELRHQYALSYYPTNAKKDGAYRRVKVRIEEPGMIVRAREGYRAAAEMQATNEAGATDRPELKRKQ